MINQDCKEEYIHRIHNVQDYIEHNMEKNITIEELAKVAGFSKYHFSRIFSSVLQESLAHYVNRIRMEKALFLLAHRPDLNMTDIAYEMGFTDSAIFSRAFRNYYGMTPSGYRREYSKNCKEPVFISEYNKEAAEKKWVENPFWKSSQITIEELEERQAVYVRHTGTYETLAKRYAWLMQKLFIGAKRQKLLKEGENQILAIYHDNPEFGEKEQFRTSLCLTVPGYLKAKEDKLLGVMRLEGGKYAVGHFEIQPEQFSDAWDYMYREWLMTSGYVPRNTYPFEVYRNNPHEDKNHMIKVDIYVPIEPIF